jgi:hypothetical protein
MRGIFGVGGGGRQFSIASTLVCSRSCKDEDSLLPLPDPYSLFFLLETALLLLLLSKSGLNKKALLIMPGCCWWRELVLLYLCQPTEPGSEELGRARPNGGAMYPGADEVSKRLPVSDEPLLVPTSPSESKPTLLLEVARRITSEVVVVVALV